MKHIKIILTLTAVVLISVVLIFYIEEVTSEVIDKENFRLANLAKFELLSELESEDLVLDDGITPLPPLDIDFSDSTITELFYFEGVGYIYTANFKGYQSEIVYMVGIDMTGDISGFKVLEQGETPGYGNTIADEEYRLQFEGLALDAAADGDIDDVAGLSGAPVTMGAFKVSLNELVTYHLVNYTSVVVETPEQRVARLLLETFPTAVTYTDVTASYEANDDISIINEVYDGTDTLLGYIYYVEATGAGYENPSIVEFFIGFDLDKEIAGFALLDDTETTGKTAEMYKDEYGTAFIGDDMESDDYGVDAIAGSTDTNVRIHEIVKEIADYHVEFILQEGVFVRPVDVEVINENLLLAFPEGITFTSVYEDYEYNEFIGNVYEVYDVTSNLIGYVYYSQFYGYNSSNGVGFVIGIDTDANTNLIEVIQSSESWGDAESIGNYDGTEGYFPDTPWLDNFEGISILDLVLNPVDAVSGVSTTTGGMLEAIEEVLQYHLFELVGGAN